ncbi:Polynucleotide adenylyltransferase family protein isoform 4 [Hibiscus syriacus]|uniref:Polynucleotide adenylyltransferase family protein isoform 4 n=1 Tax=Hibiscus syriacus TaxID=106335 RepID=A0A6A2YSK0_HIBSY|nr:Polynucleotide adenylyltransferase family protein isoform 4 [Hibiscus syriacus]
MEVGFELTTSRISDLSHIGIKRPPSMTLSFLSVPPLSSSHGNRRLRQIKEQIELTETEKKIFDRLLNTLRYFNLQTQLRVAGGWVRDKLLGKECYDIDIALDNMLGSEFVDKVQEYLSSTGEVAQGLAVIPSNPEQSKHLETARMRLFDLWIDFVNLRCEDYSENSRIPTMKFGTAEEDAFRRDLTINSLFYNINTNLVEDFTKRGLEDLKFGRIVTPLPPMATFLDDPLRVLRAIRFGLLSYASSNFIVQSSLHGARFDFTLDEELKKAAACGDVKAALAAKISRERIGTEIDLMISGNQPVKAIDYICDLTLFWVVFSLPPKVEPAVSEECYRLSAAYLDASWKLIQLIRCFNFDDEQRRLCLYSALFLPLHGTSYKDRKDKMIPAVNYIVRDSLKRKASDADTVINIHKSLEKFISLIPSLLSNEDVQITEVDWGKEFVDVPATSKLRVSTGRERVRESSKGLVRPGRSRSSPGAISWVVFVDNLSRRVQRNVLWDRFIHYGKVIKVFIPFVNRRPYYKDSTFAFVHFASKDDMHLAIEKMNNASVDGRRILVSIAKYQKKSIPRSLKRTSGARSTDAGVYGLLRELPSSQAAGSGKKEMMNKFRNGRSYKEMVVGAKEVEGQKAGSFGAKKEVKKKLEVFIPMEDRSWLRSSLTGICKPLFEVEFVQRALRTEGINVKVIQWGYAKKACLFERLEHVMEEEGVPLPYCAVSMIGVPLNCWSVPFFTSLASRWGKLVKIQEQTANRVDCRVAYMLLRVESPFDIPPHVIINTYGRSFMIKIKVEGSDEFFPELEDMAEDDGTVASREGFSPVWSQRDVQQGKDEQWGDQSVSDSQDRVEAWVRGDEKGVDTVTDGNLNLIEGTKHLLADDFCSAEVAVIGDGTSQQRLSEDFNEERENERSVEGVNLGKDKGVQDNGLNTSLVRSQTNGSVQGLLRSNTVRIQSAEMAIGEQSALNLQNWIMSPVRRRHSGRSASVSNIERGFYKNVYSRRWEVKSCNGKDLASFAEKENEGVAEALECWNVSKLLGVKFKGGEEAFMAKMAKMVPLWSMMSWNVRGLGRRVKARAIRRFVDDKKPTILFLQESKLEVVSHVLVRKMGGKLLTGSAVAPSIGSAGGLITLWNQKEFVMEDVALYSRFVALKGTMVGLPGSCCFINVYGPSLDAEKEAFFRELLSFLDNVECPLCVGGDFNVVLSQEEKEGGVVNSVTMNIFRDFVSKANLLDLPLSGGRFTWCNNRELPTFERLDRFLVDQRLVSLFPKLSQSLQARSVSDHNIVLLENKDCNWGRKPFRLFNYVMEEEGFTEMMGKELDIICKEEKGKSMSMVFKRVKGVILRWSGRGYFELPGKIKKLEGRIHEMELDMQQGLSTVTMRSIIEAKRELWDLQKKEESIWLQKSRLKWRLEGDKNTRFFHQTASVRGRNNGIKSLLVGNEVIEDPISIRNSVVEFFNGLFSQENSLEAEDINLEFRRLSEEQRLALEKPFSEEEVWRAIADSDSNKAPGPDGLNLGFFKKFWSSLKEDIMLFFKDFFEGKEWDLEVLARRFSLCINDIISPSQFAFIRGRSILDCSFIANEGIDFWRKKGLKGVVFKVDFKRAYDSVDWVILLKILGKMGFGEKWRSWMFQCMSTASVSVLLNGTPTEKIHTKRGLRQGCSLSPLLFNLGGELLHLMLTKAVDLGLFSGFELGAHDRLFKLSHLQFADNLIIFSKASIRDLKNVRRVLLIYELLVGLKINLVKSKIYGINIEEDVLVDWSKEIGCSVGKFPAEYLGLPLGSRRNSVAMWEPIVQNFYNRLSSWKFASEKDSWWKRVVCCVNNLDPNSKKVESSLTARASWIWRGVINNFFSNDGFGVCIRSNLRWKTGNGHYVAFWNDAWLGEVPLKDLFPRLYTLSMNKEGKVVEFRESNAAGWVWDIQFRRNLVDWEVDQWLHLISLLNNSSLSHDEEDCWIWLGNGEGCFSTNSCIKSFFDSDGIEGNQDFWDRNVWVGIAPPRVETFLWQVVHLRVAVKEELLKRGVAGIEDPLCPLCGRFGESVPHLFLHCEVAWGLWVRFLNLWDVDWVIPSKPLECITQWDELLPNSTIWKYIPRAVLWTVWKIRNEVIFKKGKLDVVLLFFIARFRIVSWFAASFDSQIPFDSLVGDLTLVDSMVSHKVRSKPSCWVPPPVGFIKINVDGAMVKGWSKGGIGGLIRDSSGGVCNQRIILESDSSNALKWIKNLELSTPLFHPLVKEIVSTMEGLDISLRLILRAANWEADRLAKDGIG